MTADMGYFALVRMTDPSYTAKVALKEYLYSNRKVAIDLAIELGVDNMPMDFYEFQDYLTRIGGPDAFRMGMNSLNTCFLNDEWFQLNPHGFNSMSQKEFEEWCIDEICEGYVNEIIEGRAIIPGELRQILDLWGPDGEELCHMYDCYLNVRPASSRCAPKKAPAKKPARRSTSRKPSPKKKPTVSRSSKPAAKSGTRAAAKRMKR